MNRLTATGQPRQLPPNQRLAAPRSVTGKTALALPYFRAEPADKNTGKDTGGTKAFFGKIWHFLTAPFRWLKSIFKKQKDVKTEPQSVESVQNQNSLPQAKPPRQNRKPSSRKGPKEPSTPATPVRNAAGNKSIRRKNTPADPSNPLNEIWKTGKLSLFDLFGNDLRRVHFKQREGNAGYFLSALDSILNNPRQGQLVLRKIRCEKLKNNGHYKYKIQFPGQKNSIFLSSADFKGNGVESATPGVRLLEAAYAKIPASRYSEMDNTHDVLLRILGKESLASSDEIIALKAHSLFDLARKADRAHQAAIFTAMERTPSEGRSQHYYSLRLNSGLGTIDVVDPCDTSVVKETLTPEALNKKYQVTPEIIKFPEVLLAGLVSHA